MKHGVRLILGVFECECSIKKCIISCNKAEKECRIRCCAFCSKLIRFIGEVER